jgi:UDP-2,3-diacylglucosamine hydrolase
MTTLFISDLHLDPSRPAVTRAFFDLLRNQASQADALYILGDFFEAWVGDDDDAPMINEVSVALKTLTDSGTACYLMHGNRDFLIGEAFCQRSGCQLINDPSVVELYGKPVLLMHGDSLCTRDEQYMAFRAQARSPEWQQQILSLPLEQRRALAQQLRESSAEANSNKAEDIMDVTPAEVENAMQQAGVALMIHGHTHRPAVHALQLGEQAATRVVLGDWHHSGWLLRYSPQGEYRLEEFAIAA